MVDFPWDKLRAETLRSICSDLGYSRLFYSKDVMQRLLKVVEESGFEKSFEYENEIYEARKEEKSVGPRPETPLSAKRTRGAEVVSDYDTRHKRKRISDPVPRLSRRKSAKALAAINDEPQSKRGQPPKNKSKATPKKQAAAPKTKAAAPPSSTRREIFDGILLSAPHSNSHKGKEKAEKYDDEVGDEDAEGDVDMEHEDDGIPDIQVESSLASSNKENEFVPDEASHGDPSEDQQVPDEPIRDDSTPAVLENAMQQQMEAHTTEAQTTELQPTEAQPDAGVLPAGEEVVEGWSAVAPGVLPLDPGEEMISMVETHQTYVDDELTAEDISNVEEVLRTMATNSNGF